MPLLHYGCVLAYHAGRYLSSTQRFATVYLGLWLYSWMPYERLPVLLPRLADISDTGQEPQISCPV